MTAIEIKTAVENAILKAFPNVRVRIGSLLEEDRHLGVEVFAVEKADVNAVEELILNLDWDLGVPNGFGLTPLVVNREATREHYPEMLPQWRVSPQWQGEVCQAIVETPVFPNDLTVCAIDFWSGGETLTAVVVSPAQNEELALAA